MSQGGLVPARSVPEACGAKAAGLLIAEDLGLPVPGPLLSMPFHSAVRLGRLPVPQGVASEWIVRPSFLLGIDEADQVSGLIDSFVFEESADQGAVESLMSSVASTATTVDGSVSLLLHPYMADALGGGVAHVPGWWRGESTLASVSWDPGGPSLVVSGASSHQVHISQLAPLTLLGSRTDVETLLDAVGTALLESLSGGLLSLRERLAMPIEVEWVCTAAREFVILQVQGLSNEVEE